MAFGSRKNSRPEQTENSMPLSSRKVDPLSLKTWRKLPPPKPSPEEEKRAFLENQRALEEQLSQMLGRDGTSWLNEDDDVNEFDHSCDPFVKSTPKLTEPIEISENVSAKRTQVNDEQAKIAKDSFPELPSATTHSPKWTLHKANNYSSLSNRSSSSLSRADTSASARRKPANPPSHTFSSTRFDANNRTDISTHTTKTISVKLSKEMKSQRISVKLPVKATNNPRPCN